MFYYLIITLGAGGCRKQLCSLVGRGEGRRNKPGGLRDTRPTRNHCVYMCVCRRVNYSYLASNIYMLRSRKIEVRFASRGNLDMILSLVH